VVSQGHVEPKGWEAVAVDTRSVLWVDGAAGATITRINTLTGAAAIQGGIVTISNADYLQEWEGPLTVNGSPAPIVAQYQSVTQRAVLVFTTTAPGVLVQLSVPAPQIGIFLSDGRTVDLTNVDVSALAALCAGNLCDDAGNQVVSLIAGYLQ